jgi:hypothetical protein
VTAHKVYLTTMVTMALCNWSAAQDARNIGFKYWVEPVSASVLKARSIHIVLRNDGPADVSIIQIELRLDTDLIAARQDLISPVLPCVGRTDAYRIEQQLAAGKEVELVFQYPKGAFWWPLGNLDLMTFDPAVHKLEFMALVQNPLTRAGAKMTKAVDFDCQTPPLAVTLGGGVGALSLVVLRFIYHLRKSRAKFSWKNELREAVLALAAGIVIAAVLTGVGGFLSNRAWGIQVAATNFKGGFIIGLFSYKIADFWATKLWK